MNLRFGWTICHFILLWIVPSLLYANNNAQPKYYDPLTSQFITLEEINRAPSRELFLEASVDNIVLGEVNALEFNNELWASLNEVVALLDFPISIKTLANGQIRANGWFINEDNHFSLIPELIDPKNLDATTKNYTISVKNNVYKISKFKTINQQIYFSLTEILNWFEIESEFNINDLTLTLKTGERLPIQNKKLREQREVANLVNNFDTQYPREDVEYQLLSPIMTDIQFSLTQDAVGNRSYNVSALGAGDLAYMTGHYYTSYQYADKTDLRKFNGTLYLEKNSTQRDLLGPLNASHLSLGDNRSTPISNLPSGNSFGVRVNNRPYGRITNVSTTNITGLMQPNWDVELYLNGLFIAKQTTSDNGQYNFFNQPLQVGENRFTLRFYGPQGQFQELEEIYHLDSTSAVGGDLIYDLSMTRQNIQIIDFINNESSTMEAHYGLNLHLEKGINKHMSLTSDYSQYHFNDGELHQFFQTGLRSFFWNSIFQFNHLRDIAAGSQNEFSFSKNISSSGNHVLNYSLLNQTPDMKTNSTNESSFRQSQSLALNGNLNIAKLNYGLNVSVTDYFDKRQSQSYQLNLGKSFGQLRLSNNLTYSRNKSIDNQYSSSQSGQLNAAMFWKLIYFRLAMDYAVKPDSKLKNTSLETSWNITNNISSKLTLGFNNIDAVRTEGIHLEWRNSQIITSFSINHTNGSYNSQLNLRFGLGNNPINNQLVMNSSRMSYSGAVAAQVYEDRNHNLRRDKDEPLIEGVEVEAKQQHRRAVTNENGVAFISGLYGGQATDVSVNEATLPDPFMIPAKEGISFMPRPGLVKTVYIPVVTSGEVEGMINYSDNLFKPSRDQGRVPLELINEEGVEILKTKSAFDGFFLFEKIPPGEYKLQVSPQFLEDNSLMTRNPISIKITPKGTLILGANFTLRPKNVFNYKSATDSTTVAYRLDLGTFLSEENARIIVESLRAIFPEVLSQIMTTSAIEMFLVKKSDHQHQILIGPFYNLNNVRYICGSLAKENLHCQAIKLK